VSEHSHGYLEKNDQALADNLDDLRKEVDRRLTAIESELVAIKSQVAGQTRVIGESLQAVWGSGSTVPDPNPEDTR